MKKITFKQFMSLLSLIAAIGFGTAGFCVAPVGSISSSVLILIAQFLTMSGTYLGLDVYFSKFINLLKNDKDENQQGKH